MGRIVDYSSRSAVRRPRLAGRSSQAAVRSPQSAVRGPRSVGRSSQAAVRSPQSAVRIPSGEPMSKNINVNPGQYKVKGRERQGEDVLVEKNKMNVAKTRAKGPEKRRAGKKR